MFRVKISFTKLEKFLRVILKQINLSKSASIYNVEKKDVTFKYVLKIFQGCLGTYFCNGQSTTIIIDR